MKIWTAGDKLKATDLNSNFSDVSLKYFRDGSDGDVVLTTNTTLTRDMYYNNLTINAGIILNPAGYHIYVKNTIGGAGKIQLNGGNGGSTTTWDAGIGGAGTPTGTLIGGPAGKNGGISADNITGFGVNGSSGGGGSITSPGSGGIVSADILKAIPVGSVISLSKNGILQQGQIPLYYSFVNNLLSSLLAGSAGSGGGSTSNQTSGYGGGGGGGGAGGLIFITAKTITGSLIFEATGGNGGNGSSGSYGAGGGGGGGAGGNVFLVYEDISLFTGSINLSGGIGGLNGNGNPSGQDGLTGNYYKIKLI